MLSSGSTFSKMLSIPPEPSWSVSAIVGTFLLQPRTSSVSEISVSESSDNGPYFTLFHPSDSISFCRPVSDLLKASSHVNTVRGANLIDEEHCLTFNCSRTDGGGANCSSCDGGVLTGVILISCLLCLAT